MIINKYNKKSLFIINELNKKSNELSTTNNSEELNNYIFKKLVKNLVNVGHVEKIINPINSNLIDKKVVEDLFNNAVSTLEIIDSKLNELSFLNKNLNDNIDYIINPLFLKVNKLTSKNTTDIISSSVINEYFDKTKFYDNKDCSLKNSFLELTNDEYVDELYTAIVEVTSSNGLPGDTHRAYISNNEVIFNGEEELSLNLNNIFSKSKSLVYEAINVQPSEYKKTYGYGFKYDEGISFLNNDKVLRLNIKVTFTSPKKVNIIKFNDSQISSYVIEKLKIIDDNGTAVTIADNKNSSIFNVFNFKECNMTTLLFELVQYNQEKSYIGHYYNSVLKESNNSFKIEYESIKIGSILNLGVTVDTDNKIKHGKTKSSDTSFLNKESIIKKNLYDNKLNRELILADRSSISINSLMCFLKKYRKTGTCIFKYDVKEPINGVTLDANEFMPQSTSISYFMSFDNINWHSIKPLYRVGNDEIHTINLNSIVTSSNINTKTIFTNDKQYTIYLKIVLKTDNINVSPIINSLSLKIRE